LILPPIDELSGSNRSEISDVTFFVSFFGIGRSFSVRFFLGGGGGCGAASSVADED
jgi:hypothetical protein